MVNHFNKSECTLGGEKEVVSIWDLKGCLKGCTAIDEYFVVDFEFYKLIYILNIYLFLYLKN